jgi:hypothetical protein
MEATGSSEMFLAILPDNTASPPKGSNLCSYGRESLKLHVI